MIKISFSGLDFFPVSTFTDETNIDYRMIPINDLIVSNSVQWNGETLNVQNVFYDAFKLTFLVRENKKNGFSKIAYAPNITVYNSENDKTINAKFINVEFSKINEKQEFYLCTFEFADLSTKNIQNNYNNNTALELYTIKFNPTKIGTQSEHTSNFIPYLEINPTKSVKNDFKDEILEYRKNKVGWNYLLFLKDSEITDFFSNFNEVGGNIQMKIFDTSGDIVAYVDEVDIEIKRFGQGLNELRLKLISSNDIYFSQN